MWVEGAIVRSNTCVCSVSRVSGDWSSVWVWSEQRGDGARKVIHLPRQATHTNFRYTPGFKCVPVLGALGRVGGADGRACGLCLCMVYGGWRMVYGVWCMVHGVQGVWLRVYGLGCRTWLDWDPKTSSKEKERERARARARERERERAPGQIGSRRLHRRRERETERGRKRETDGERERDRKREDLSRLGAEDIIKVVARPGLPVPRTLDHHHLLPVFRGWGSTTLMQSNCGTTTPARARETDASSTPDLASSTQVFRGVPLKDVKSGWCEPSGVVLYTTNHIK